MGITNDTVIKTICDNPDKRAFLLMQVGIAYSIYSDFDRGCCNAYIKRKMMRQKACNHFELAINLGNDNALFYYYMALSLYELGQINQAKLLMQDFVQKGVEQTECEPFICLWAILMGHSGQFREAIKLLKYAIKNSFGFTAMTQLVKA